MRKKIPDEEKKITISVSLHPQLLELLKNYTKKINQNKSKVIEELLMNYFNKNK